MVLRHVRLSTAALLALVALAVAPARSRADTQILIQELDSSGSVIQTLPVFTGTSAITSTTHFSVVGVNVTPSMLIGSMTTNVGAQTAVNMSGSSYFQLQVTVTSDGFTVPTSSGRLDVSNSAGASTALGGGENIITNQTQLFSGTLATALTPLGPKTAVATDILPVPGSSPTRITPGSDPLLSPIG